MARTKKKIPSPPAIVTRDQHMSDESKKYLDLLCQPLNVDIELTQEMFNELENEIFELKINVDDLEIDNEREAQNSNEEYTRRKDLEVDHQEQVDELESVIEDLKAQLKKRSKTIKPHEYKLELVK